MPSSANIARPRTCNVWTEEQRVVLHLLSTKFELDYKTRSRVWNEYFKDHLRSCGLLTGLNANALRSQYGERTKKAHIWGNVLAEPHTDEQRQERFRLTKEIQKVIAGLDLRSDVLSRSVVAGDRNSQTVQVTARSTTARTRAPSKTPARCSTVQRPSTSLLTPLPTPESDVAAPQPTLEKCSALTTSSVRSPKTRSHNAWQPPGPTPASRSRSQDRMGDDLEDPDFDPSPSPRPLTRIRRAPGRSNRQTQERSEYLRRNGGSLSLTDKEHALAREPLFPVTEVLAHPPDPELLFRYWNEYSHGINMEGDQGFVCGRYMHSNLEPRAAPKSTEVDWSDLELHMQRAPTSTPYISTSNCLVWIIRLALKEARKGAKKGRVAFIAPSLLRDSPYHMLPFWQQIRKKKPFRDGAWRYGGLHEFVVYHEIPRESIISSFSVPELSKLVDRHAGLKNVLRLDDMWFDRSLKRNIKNSIMSRWEADPVALDESAASAIGRLCHFFGLNAASPKVLQNIVSEVVQGWRLKVQHHTNTQWASMSTYWVHGLCDRSTIVTSEREQELKMCFLHAVKEGLADFNMLHTSKAIAKMEKKGETIGLVSPAKIVLADLERAKRAIQGYDKEQKERLSGTLQRLLPAVEPRVRAGRSTRTVAAVMLNIDVEPMDEDDPEDEEGIANDLGDEDEIMYEADDDQRGLCELDGRT